MRSFKPGIITVAAILLAATLSFCKKPAGPGGKASIKGKIYAKDFNTAAFGAPIAEYFIPGESVYICYGTSTATGNSVKTGPDGSFEFLYLRTGHYKIFANSRDTSIHVSGSSKVIPVSAEIDITGNKQSYDAGTIVINK
jgi:hypothetical protein